MLYDTKPFIRVQPSLNIFNPKCIALFGADFLQLVCMEVLVYLLEAELELDTGRESLQG